MVAKRRRGKAAAVRALQGDATPTAVQSDVAGASTRPARVGVRPGGGVCELRT